jgi:hypothetical protein
MKKFSCLLILSVLLIWLFASFARADSSDELTGDALVISGPACITGVVVMTDAANPVTMNIYGNTAASGKKLIPTYTVTTSATDRAQAIFFPENTVCTSKGIYVDITCSGTVGYMIYYDKK